MSRFFVASNLIGEKDIKITSSDANHITNVLRKKKGDHITVCDSQGNDYECEISDISKDYVMCGIISIKKCRSEDDFKIILYQAIPKTDKMELIIQKCVELGVYRIVPILTEHTIVKVNDKTQEKTERWQKISEAAAKQCGRGIIPEISPVKDYKEALESALKYDGIMFPYENETNSSIKNYLRDYRGKSLAIFIGPEGGFTASEAEEAKNKGAASVTLGRRILRTETAAIAACTLVMYEMSL